MKDLSDVRPYLRSRFMMKYAWAKEGLLYELTENDMKYLQFQGKKNYKDYPDIKRIYEDLFIKERKLIASDKLW